MNFVFFFIIFIYLVNWMQIGTFLTKFISPKLSYKIVSDQRVTNLIMKKTGVKIEKFYLLNSDNPFGGMFSLFGKPILMLSDELYNNFNKDELEYVLLHEIGHYLYSHSLQNILGQTVLGLIGVYIINFFGLNIIPSSIFGIIFALIFVEFAKWHERQVENFAVKKIANPNGMVTAAHKLKKRAKTGLFYEIRRRYFVWNIMPSERMAIAQSEIDRRKVN